MLRDYSYWLNVEENFQHELAAWKVDEFYKQYAGYVDDLRLHRNIHSIFEFGCGVGFVPRHLGAPPFRYVGLDNSFNCVAEAQKDQLQWMRFELGDIRTWQCPGPGKFDLACSFSVLKHFSLEEFPEILKKFLSYGKCGLFSVLASSIDIDDGGPENDGGPYHHLWVSSATLIDSIIGAGHKTVTSWTGWKGTHHGTSGRELFVVTEEAV